MTKLIENRATAYIDSIAGTVPLSSLPQIKAGYRAAFNEAIRLAAKEIRRTNDYYSDFSLSGLALTIEAIPHLTILPPCPPDCEACEIEREFGGTHE